MNTFYIEIKEELEGVLAGDVTYTILGTVSSSSLIRNSTTGECYTDRNLGMKYYEISTFAAQDRYPAQHHEQEDIHPHSNA